MLLFLESFASKREASQKTGPTGLQKRDPAGKETSGSLHYTLNCLRCVTGHQTLTLIQSKLPVSPITLHIYPFLRNSNYNSSEALHLQSLMPRQATQSPGGCTAWATLAAKSKGSKSMSFVRNMLLPTGLGEEGVVQFQRDISGWGSVVSGGISPWFSGNRGNQCRKQGCAIFLCYVSQAPGTSRLPPSRQSSTPFAALRSGDWLKFQVFMHAGGAEQTYEDG